MQAHRGSRCHFGLLVKNGEDSVCRNNSSRYDLAHKVPYIIYTYIYVCVRV